jgi:SAM-dependent methyltransferase
MTVPKEAVVWGYRLLLGREPESEQAIRDHTSARDEAHLAEILIGSEEFAAKQHLPNLTRVSMSLDEAPIEVEAAATPAQLAGCLAKIKEAWAHMGILRPHFSVLTDTQFLPENLHQNIDGFWASGQGEVEQVMKILARHEFHPDRGKNCVEYGCGVGRVTMALAGKFKRVDAYDISPGHLERARQRAQETGVRNVALHECSSNMLASLEKCDFFYSRIVFQHNPPPVIIELIRTALAALKPGGIALFQVPTYIVGYRFKLREWLETEHPLDMQMHCVPQATIFELVAAQQCSVVEIREDDSTGARDRMLSNTFVVRRQGRGSALKALFGAS